MSELNPNDLWRIIPPEEKLQAMARAQASGVFATMIVLAIGGTLAAALRMNGLFWGSLLLVPFLYQGAASKAWRKLKPALILEYLAARSAARRYAFAAAGKDLSVRFMLRGKFEEVAVGDVIPELEAAIGKLKEAEVWIALFGDSVVVISERPGGAACELAHVLNDKVEIKGESASGNEYSNDRKILLTVRDKNKAARAVRLESDHPAALIVFEKKLLEAQEEYLLRLGGSTTTTSP